MKPNPLARINFLTRQIGQHAAPVLSAYALGVMIFRLHRSPEVEPRPASLEVQALGRQQYKEMESQLLSVGVLERIPHLRGKAYSIFGRSKAPAAEFICGVDPFCYISHLSAMEFHGLTDRLPHTLFVSSPSTSEWRKLAKEQMQKELVEYYPAYIAARFPHLVSFRMEKFGKTPIEYINSSHLGAFKNIHDRSLRVSTIGRTFLDMLRRPDLCGGMQHVIDVYKDTARKYLRLIQDEIDAHGTGIEKVRAGYILSEFCGARSDARIQAWKEQFAQRGGSRKLDPTGEFSPTFSEDWSLSLNVPSLETYEPS